MKYTNQ